MSGGCIIKTWLSASTAAEKLNGGDEANGREVSCFTGAQLSADATTIFTTDYGRNFSIYGCPLPADETRQKKHLVPYAQLTAADSLRAFAVNPAFSRSDPYSTTVLISQKDQYISLHNVLRDLNWDYAQYYAAYYAPTQAGPYVPPKLASYKLINPFNEQVVAPDSLAWSWDRCRFFAGSENSIHIFDIARTDESFRVIPTISSKRGGVGFKGAVTALAVCPPTPTNDADVLIAAGTRNTRHVGIFDSRVYNAYNADTAFPLPGEIEGRDNPAVKGLVGRGVTQLKWSPDGTYLYVAERNSDALLIYDKRKYSMAFGYCTGRKANVSHRMDFDIWSGFDQARHEVWAGGTDGMVRVWRYPYLCEGAVEPEETINVGDDPVNSVMVHPTGYSAIVALGNMKVGSDGMEGIGLHRGAQNLPKLRHWGSLDILGLSSY